MAVRDYEQSVPALIISTETSEQPVLEGQSQGKAHPFGYFWLQSPSASPLTAQFRFRWLLASTLLDPRRELR
jgi:hypothetical protein